jgi:ribonuclease P protein component
MREKEQSNLTAPSPRRLILPKSRILRGRTNFKSLFSNSKSLSSASVLLKYRIEETKSPEFKIAFIAPKKIGTAVKRNRIKRLMREAYRLNQQIVDSLTESSFLVHIALIARTSDTDFLPLREDVVTLLNKLRTRVAEQPLINT